MVKMWRGTWEREYRRKGLGIIKLERGDVDREESGQKDWRSMNTR